MLLQHLIAACVTIPCDMSPLRIEHICTAAHRQSAPLRALGRPAAGSGLRNARHPLLACCSTCLAAGPSRLAASPLSLLLDQGCPSRARVRQIRIHSAPQQRVLYLGRRTLCRPCRPPCCSCLLLQGHHDCVVAQLVHRRLHTEGRHTLGLTPAATPLDYR